jgi:hypothetical protein
MASGVILFHSHNSRRVDKETKDMATNRGALVINLRDLERLPVTEHELMTWVGMSDGERAVFEGYLSTTFRWLLATLGDDFQTWLTCAVSLSKHGALGTGDVRVRVTTR